MHPITGIMLMLLSVPGDVLDDWMDNDDGTVIGSVIHEDDGSISLKGSTGEDYNVVRAPQTDIAYTLIDATRLDQTSLGETIGVCVHKLKRRYDDGLYTKVEKRIQRLNSDRLRKLNKRSVSSSLSSTPGTSGFSTPLTTPQQSMDLPRELLDKERRKDIVLYKSSLSQDQQDFVIEEVMRVMKKEKTYTFTLSRIMTLESLKDINRRDMIDPLKLFATIKSGTWTVMDNYRSMYGI